MRNNWFSYDIMTEAIFDYMGPVGGLLYGWCMAGVAGAWFIPTVLGDVCCFPAAPLVITVFVYLPV